MNKISYLNLVILSVAVPIILFFVLFVTLERIKVTQITQRTRETVPEPKQVSLKVEDVLTREDVLEIARAIRNDPHLCKDKVRITNDWKIVHVEEGNIPYSWDCYSGKIDRDEGYIIIEVIDIGPGRLWPPEPSDGKIDDFDILRVFEYNIGGKKEFEIMDKGIHGPELRNKHYTKLLESVKANIQDIYQDIYQDGKF